MSNRCISVFSLKQYAVTNIGGAEFVVKRTALALTNNWRLEASESLLTEHTLGLSFNVLRKCLSHVVCRVSGI